MTATWHREFHRHVTWRLVDEQTKDELATVLYLSGSKHWQASYQFAGHSGYTIRGTATAARQSAQNWLDRQWNNPAITNPA